MPPIVEVNGLTKRFPGGITAVNNITFQVHEGEIFGFLGPNGAGKSTTIMMLTTLLRPTSGRAHIAGFDIIKQPNQVRSVIGYVSQDLAVDDNLTGRENLRLQAGFYHLPAREARARIAELLDLVGLNERADFRVETYSGGMRKRLDIAAGLLHRPRLLFLDEPTLGLDIQTRREIWRYVTGLQQSFGMTIFLTTHYLEEADVLCDHIAIIDQGVIKTIDTPGHLKAQFGGDIVTLRFAPGTSQEQEALALESIARLDVVSNIQKTGDEVMIITPDGDRTVPVVFETIQPLDVSVQSVTVKRPSLDDVYVAVTGRHLRDEVIDAEASRRARIRMRRVKS
ncbi:MAG: ATP-binding cassette domain-containing protein [Peptococcaceae bacterium]|nr:ATP-binding cassette domain-containing protein [Peptococcaceae bacterium]